MTYLLTRDHHGTIARVSRYPLTAKVDAIPDFRQMPFADWLVARQDDKTWHGYESIPIHTIFSGMNIHLPAILMLTKYQGFDPRPHNAFRLWFSCKRAMFSLGSSATCFFALEMGSVFFAQTSIDPSGDVLCYQPALEECHLAEMDHIWRWVKLGSASHICHIYGSQSHDSWHFDHRSHVAPSWLTGWFDR